MESILQIIVLLAFVRFACRATFFRSIWSVLVFALLVAALSFLSYPVVIEQAGDFYTTLLSDPTLVGNVAVLITLEALLGMLLSMGLLHTLLAKKKNAHFHLLRYVPELLILGAVLYAEQQMFYALPGYNFRLTATLTSATFAAAIGLLTFFMRKALPERSNRYELNFLINTFLLLLAVFLNAGLSPYNTGNYDSNLDWKSSIAFFLITFVFFTLGFVLLQLKLKNKKLKKILKWI